MVADGDICVREDEGRASRSVGLSSSHRATGRRESGAPAALVDPRTRLRIRDHVAFLPTAEGVTVLDADGNLRYSVNRTGFSILKACRQGLAVLDVAERLSRAEQLPLGRAYHDVRGFAARCIRLGLLETIE